MPQQKFRSARTNHTAPVVGDPTGNTAPSRRLPSPVPPYRYSDGQIIPFLAPPAPSIRRAFGSEARQTPSDGCENEF